MKVQVATRNSLTYVGEIVGVLETERDVVNLIGLCGEHSTDRLILRVHNLLKEFLT
jgi:hypothetical protein